MTRTTVVAIILVLGLVPSTTVHAQTSNAHLFRESGALVELNREERSALEKISAIDGLKAPRIVKLRIPSEAESILQLDGLIERTGLVVSREKVGQKDNQSFWSGESSDHLSSAWIWRSDNDGMYGRLYDDAVDYYLSPLGREFHALSEIDRSVVFQDHPPNIPYWDSYQLLDPSNAETRATYVTNEAGVSKTSSDTVVRVAVAYTYGAQAKAANIHNTIITEQGNTNWIYQNSGIAGEIEIVGDYLYPISNEGNVIYDLYDWRNDPDTQTKRELYQADIMILLQEITYPSNSCGLAYPQAWGGGTSAGPATAFASVDIDCLYTNYSFQHEIGHLFGAGHNVGMPGGSTAWAYGKVDWDHDLSSVTWEWRTIMAYPDGSNCYVCGCPRRAQFSNALQNRWVTDCVPGQPSVAKNFAMGSAAQHDVARIHNDRWSAVANFYFFDPAKNSQDESDRDIVERDALALVIYPKPASGSVYFSIRGTEMSTLNLEVFDLLGRLVFAEAVPGGDRNMTRHTWDGRGFDGGRVPQGLYVVRIVTNGRKKTATIVMTN